MYDTVGFFSKIKGYYVNGDYYAKRILEMFKIDNRESFGNKAISVLKGEINIKNLSFGYDNKTILNNINLQIKPNTLNAIIGSSGSGKSTLFFLLSKLYDVKDGSILYDDIDINKFDEVSLRKNVCLVNQEPFLFHDTILNNIKIVKPDATNEEVKKACKLANVHNEIMSFENGYTTILSENGGNLSGGQRQRIEIARAILKDSKIILLDEPTSALDAKNQSLLFNTLSSLKKEKTIIVIVHKLNKFDVFDNVFEIKNANISKIKN